MVGGDGPSSVTVDAGAAVMMVLVYVYVVSTKVLVTSAIWARLRRAGMGQHCFRVRGKVWQVLPTTTESDVWDARVSAGR